MLVWRSALEVSGFRGADGALVRELAGRSTGLTSHSLAVIEHPSGTESIEHRHVVADEVYLVWSGHGRVRVAGEMRNVGPGDTVIIHPGQNHKVWSDGPGDLVLVVSCAPAYDTGDVIWET